MLTLEVEAYYKQVENRIDYVNGSDLIGNNTIETEILNGEAKAYGLEFLLRKTKGNFTGWLAYTISKSEQRTPGGSAGGPESMMETGITLLMTEPMIFQFTGTYRLNKKWSFSANLIYQTGRPVTYPNGQYEYEGLVHCKLLRPKCR